MGEETATDFARFNFCNCLMIGTRRIAVRPKVRASVIGKASQTPLKSQNCGRVNIRGIKKIIGLARDVINAGKAFPRA